MSEAVKKNAAHGRLQGTMMTLPLFIFAHFFHHLLTALPIPLLPLIRTDFGLDYTRSGMVISAFNMSYGIGQIPGGWLSDRAGPRFAMTMGICGLAIAGFLVGVSHTYVMLIIFLALMGLVGGGYHPSSTMLLSRLDPSHRGRFLGLHMVGGSASYFLSPLIAAGMAGAWGWRGSFLGLAVPTMAFGLVFYWYTAKMSSAGVETLQVSSGSKVVSGKPKGSLILFIIMATSVQAMYFSVLAFLALYMTDFIGTDKATAMGAVAFMYSCGIWAAPLGGYLSDRLGRIPVSLGTFFLLGPVILALAFTPRGPLVAVVLVILGMLIYLHPATNQAYIVENSPARYRSTMLGIYFFGNQEGNGLLSPLLGYLIDRFGFQTSFSIAAGAIFLIALCCGLPLVWLIRKKARSAIPE